MSTTNPPTEAEAAAMRFGECAKGMLEAAREAVAAELTKRDGKIMQQQQQIRQLESLRQEANKRVMDRNRMVQESGDFQSRLGVAISQLTAMTSNRDSLAAELAAARAEAEKLRGERDEVREARTKERERVETFMAVILQGKDEAACWAIGERVQRSLDAVRAVRAERDRLREFLGGEVRKSLMGAHGATLSKYSLDPHDSTEYGGLVDRIDALLAPPPSVAGGVRVFQYGKSTGLNGIGYAAIRGSEVFYLHMYQGRHVWEISNLRKTADEYREYYPGEPELSAPEAIALLAKHPLPAPAEKPVEHEVLRAWRGRMNTSVIVLQLREMDDHETTWWSDDGKTFKRIGSCVADLKRHECPEITDPVRLAEIRKLWDEAKQSKPVTDASPLEHIQICDCHGVGIRRVTVTELAELLHMGADHK